MIRGMRMTYKKRNIIVLAVFMTIISLLSGSMVYFVYPTKINKIKGDIKETKAQIAALDGIEAEFYRLDDIISEKKQKLSELDKEIVSSVSPAASYTYLNHILNYSGLLQFDLFFKGNEKADHYQYSVYRLKGEGNYWKIYGFISYLEQGPELYKINRLKLRMVESKDEETGRYQITLPFEMELWALYAQVDGMPSIKRTLGDVTIHRTSNPFYPYIYREIPSNTEELLEVERATLKAVLPNKALITDVSGRIYSLQPGDRVYLGYLSNINLENNEVEFILNKGGIIEKYTLKLNFDKKITGKTENEN